MKFCYKHKVSINATWVPDEDTNECYCCHGIFTFSIRRHHCRTCGNCVCFSCSKTKEMINGNKVRICRSCNAYLWIKRSGENIENLMNLINECLLNYFNKWSNIKLLLETQSKIINQIQINHEKNNFSDDNNNELNKIESLLESERINDNMIYFIATPPKHNPKLSPWTRRLFLITNDSKILMSSPLDNTYSLYQFITETNTKTFIHFQYYAPLNRLFQQQIIPINQQQFNHIPQFKKIKQKTVIIFMTKRNAKLKSHTHIETNNSSENNNYSSVVIKNNNWSYFKDKNKTITENTNTNGNTNGNNKYYPKIENGEDILIDINKRNPTLVILPFCVWYNKPKLPIERPPLPPTQVTQQPSSIINNIFFNNKQEIKENYSIFNEYDWKCLINNNSFDSSQNLYDTLNCHRHKYLRIFYKNIVLFHEIIELMSKSVEWSNENHLLKLEILWNNLIIHTTEYKKLPITFSKMLSIKNGPHKYWKEIGFQGKNPLTDFRGMGEFALNCLVYFATNYQSHCQVIFSKTRNENNYYPLCASFINIVNLICELTNARKVEQLDITQQTLLFKLFILDNNYSNNAFQELFCLICRVFDNVWRATKSFYWDFPKLYNAFRDRITFLLSKEPKSLKTLMEWLEVDTYIFEYKEADFNQMDSFDQNLIFLNGK